MTTATLASRPRIVMVTNIPAPYRIPIYQRLSEQLGEERFQVIFCADRENNRQWSTQPAQFPHTVLQPKFIAWNGRYIHFNLDTFAVLRQLKPDVVITTGYNPTHLLAFAYAWLNNKIHIPQTDGTLDSEKNLSCLHRWVRRWVFRYSRAFIGASAGSLALYRHYGIAATDCFQSHLCVDNRCFSDQIQRRRQYDLMFSGRFEPVKNPLFALDVAAGVAKRLRRRVSMLLLGSGPLLEQARQHALSLSEHVDAHFPGFIQQAELPEQYGQAKVFLFPSSWDPWGVVANEAAAAGQAIIVSPHAGVAGDLVLDGINGFVCELELQHWIDKAARLLEDSSLWQSFSNHSQERVQPFNYPAATQGVIDAVAWSCRDQRAAHNNP